ncbi:Phosphatidate cytidylyltransferase [Clostridiaceae bacterium JG1575]|nr:Phosphatidate cytidylyltransferase [Clostridiaceae bacterium JG1575]
MKLFEDVREPLANNRYFGTLFLLPILLAFVLGGTYLKIMVALMGLRAMYEFFVVVSHRGVKPLWRAASLLAALQFLLFFLDKGRMNIVPVLILLLTVVSLITTVFRRNYDFLDAAVTILGYIYTISFFSLILLIYRMEGGTWYILTLFTIAWGCDTFAYFSGRFWGRRKLIPEVSPKKTVEGALGGLLGGSLITFLFGLIVRSFGVPLMHPLHFLAMGLIGALFSQIGDLIASAIKRDCGVKDYPKLIPGHGGILDRFDSVLLAAVSVFLYLTVFLGH